MGMIYAPSNIIPNGALINNVCYINQSTKPTTRPDGSGLVARDRWYNSANGTDFYWNGDTWYSQSKVSYLSGTMPNVANTVIELGSVQGVSDFIQIQIFRDYRGAKMYNLHWHFATGFTGSWQRLDAQEEVGFYGHEGFWLEVKYDSSTYTIFFRLAGQGNGGYPYTVKFVFNSPDNEFTPLNTSSIDTTVTSFYPLSGFRYANGFTFSKQIIECSNGIRSPWNTNLIISPRGTGALVTQTPDNTATGGNARGTRAIDLQLQRLLASQVASGDNSLLAGKNSTASGINSIALGENATSNGIDAVVFSNSNSRSISGVLLLPQNILQDKYQAGFLVLGKQTTNATITTLTSDANAPSTTNQLTLNNNSTLAFSGRIVAAITNGGNSSYWEFKGLIKRGANAAATSLVGLVTTTLISQDSGASSWVVTISADTTNGCLKVEFTGQSSTTIRVNCTLQFNEVSY